MQTIDIEHPSPKQLRKMLRGEKVRVKKGSGLSISVHPETYNLVARAFNRSKGADIGLSAQELDAMNITSGLQRIEQFDTAGNPISQTNVNNMPTRVPQPAPPPPAPHMLGMGISGIRHPHKHNNMASQIEQVKHYDNMNKHLGTNFDYMGSAGYAKAVADKLGAQLSEASFSARKRLEHPHNEDEQPISRGQGIHHRHDITIRGRGTSLLHTQVNPPAYKSQPLNENFQMQHFMPPQFQTHKNIHGGNIHQAFDSQADKINFGMKSHLNPSQYHGNGLYAGGHGHGFGLGP